MPKTEDPPTSFDKHLRHHKTRQSGTLSKSTFWVDFSTSIHSWQQLKEIKENSAKWNRFFRRPNVVCVEVVKPITVLWPPQPQVSRPHPSDNPLLFLFLVGGVTPSELRLIKETVAALKPGSQVSGPRSGPAGSSFSSFSENARLEISCR